LVSIEGYSPKQFDKLSLTISSDEAGVFGIQASISSFNMLQKMELKLEDLLQYQFENQQVISLFDGSAKVNVNLLIYLINKKFYK
jgi:Ras GTPase-activating-like protein IQGAP2/3